MSILRMTSEVFEQIRARAEEAYPHECCGVLLGRADRAGWHIEMAVAAENIHGSTHNRYEIAPLELFTIENKARGQGLEIAGFYHSHPDHPAQWSATDFAEAHWLGCYYMITEVVRGKSAVTNSFVLCGETEEGKHFERQVILIDGLVSGSATAGHDESNAV